MSRLLDYNIFDLSSVGGSKDVKILKEEVSCQNQIIQGLLNEHNTETVVSDNITINDCLEAPIKDFKLCGKEIKQETREGYNKFKNFSYDNDSIIDSGITLTLQKNGKILINGTSTKENWFEIMYALKAETTIQNEKIVELDSSKTYTSIVKKAGGSNSKNVSVSMQKNINTSSGVITLTPSNTGNYKLVTEADGLYRAWIYIPTETVCNNLELEIMVLEGEYTLENAPSYEKYGQSPSVNYPSNLEYAEGNQKIQQYSNLYDSTQDILGKIVNLNSLGLQDNNLWNTSDLIEVVSNSDICFSYDISSKSQLQISQYTEDDVETATISNMGDFRANADNKLVVRLNKDTKYIRVGYRNDLYHNKLMLNYGTERMEYTEYQKSKIYELTNVPEMLSENDYIYYDEDSKKYFVHNEWDKISDFSDLLLEPIPRKC